MWFVQESEILSLLPSQELLSNLKHFSVHQLVKKDTIMYHPNDPSEYVYLIKKGRVRLVRITKDGHQITLSLLNKGMIFGEGDVLNEKTYTHYAETIEPSYICGIHKKDFKELLEKYDDVNKMILSILHRRLKEAQEQIELLAFSDVKTRLVHNLYLLSNRFGKVCNKNSNKCTLIDLKLSQDQLADFIGTSRESVNRIIKDMKEEGVIDLQGRKMLLTPTFYEQYSI